MASINNRDATMELALAVAENRPQDAKRLLAMGADPNVRDNRKVTALMVAASNGYGECVKALLEAGARPNT